jgi:hypothetical protein
LPEKLQVSFFLGYYFVIELLPSKKHFSKRLSQTLVAATVLYNSAKKTQWSFSLWIFLAQI